MCVILLCAGDYGVLLLLLSPSFLSLKLFSPLPSSLFLSQRVMEQEEDSALLKAYIAEWTKYFTQCSFLPMPFQALETAAGATKFHKKTQEGNRVYTVSSSWRRGRGGGRSEGRGGEEGGRGGRGAEEERREGSRGGEGEEGKGDGKRGEGVGRGGRR